MLIDAHCHILSNEYDDPTNIISKCLDSGINKLIINGYDLKTSKEAVLLASKYKNVYAAIGIGPESVDDIKTSDIDEIKRLVENEKVIAIGEIGLDYYWTKENKEKQIYIFKEMLNIAKENNLPVIVHSRSSISDAYNILEEYKVKGIMHCYSGSLEMANRFIKLGFLIGIGGVVTFKNAKEIVNVVQNIDVTNISLETDSPYLSPEPNRGQKNSPLNLIYIAKKIAEIKNIDINVVKETTTKNVENMFKI